MLASKYEEHRVTYPCFVQPKVDGIRAYYRKGNLYSRDRKLLKVTTHITDTLRMLKLPDDVILDGELYKHGWSLPRINGAIGVNREVATEDTTQVGYIIFDIIHDKCKFAKRLEFLWRHIVPRLITPITFMPTVTVRSKEDADALYAAFKNDGLEGMIYRIGDCEYRSGARSLSLLKRKDWLDEWCNVIALTEGKHTELGSRLVGTLGSVTCMFTNGIQFDVGSGFTDKERAKIWKDPSCIHRIHVKYECLSADGKPLKPTCIEWN